MATPDFRPKVRTSPFDVRHVKQNGNDFQQVPYVPGLPPHRYTIQVGKVAGSSGSSWHVIWRDNSSGQTAWWYHPSQSPALYCSIGCDKDAKVKKAKVHDGPDFKPGSGPPPSAFSEGPNDIQITDEVPDGNPGTCRYVYSGGRAWKIC
jgi:hypothetical protein